MKNIVILIAVSLLASQTHALPTDLEGSWRLTGVTCNGTESTTLTNSDLASTKIQQVYLPSTGAGYRTWMDMTNYCASGTNMNNPSASGGYITFTDDTTYCSSSNCMVGCNTAGNTQSFPYSVSSNTLTVTVNDYSPFGNPCAGQDGPIVFTYSK